MSKKKIMLIFRIMGQVLYIFISKKRCLRNFHNKHRAEKENDKLPSSYRRRSGLLCSKRNVFHLRDGKIVMHIKKDVHGMLKKIPNVTRRENIPKLRKNKNLKGAPILVCSRPPLFPPQKS